MAMNSAMIELHRNSAREGTAPGRNNTWKEQRLNMQALGPKQTLGIDGCEISGGQRFVGFAASATSSRVRDDLDDVFRYRLGQASEYLWIATCREVQRNDGRGQIVT